jgi:septum site-determining protein MinC
LYADHEPNRTARPIPCSSSRAACSPSRCWNWPATTSSLDRQLAAKVAQAPNFFSNTPLVLALDKLPANEGAIDLPGLMRVCRPWPAHPGDPRQPHRTSPPPSPSTCRCCRPPAPASARWTDEGEVVKNGKPPEPTIKPTKSSPPVRGGQQIYARAATWW